MRMKDRVVEAGKDQVIIDEACENLVEKIREDWWMQRRGRAKVHGQLWFTRKIEAKGENRESVEKRRMCKKAVGRTKRSFESRQNEPDDLIRSPRYGL